MLKDRDEMRAIRKSRLEAGVGDRCSCSEQFFCIRELFRFKENTRRDLHIFTESAVERSLTYVMPFKYIRDTSYLGKVVVDVVNYPLYLKRQTRRREYRVIVTLFIKKEQNVKNLGGLRQLIILL